MEKITETRNTNRLISHLMRSRSGKFSLGIILLFFVIAFFADFISNEKPIYCVHQGEVYYPIFNSYGNDLGISNLNHPDYTKDWRDIKFEKVWWPILPYSGYTTDLKNKFKSPFEKKIVINKFGKHPLGSSSLGKDVAAGIIHGSRVALLVGICSMFIAAILGIFFGGLAGYFGDDKIKISWLHLLLLIPFLILGCYWAYISTFNFANSFWQLFFGKLILFLSIIFPLAFAEWLCGILKIKKNIAFPIDLLIMRLIEIVNSIPGLLLLFALLAIIDAPSVLTLIIIIGFVRWTSIARFVRAEMLKLREVEFVQSAKVLGLSSVRTFLIHALPNALTPVLITIAFGIASAILIEASLSFLSLGVSEETMTWGKMLSYAREKPSAWWLAIFPGFAIFLCVYAFNNLGEILSQKRN